MKLTFGKRGSGNAAVLDAPEENLAQEKEWLPREPAPAGMLHRARLDETDGGYSTSEESEKSYRPKRESMRYKLQMGIPGSIAGKIVMGGIAFVVLGAGAAAILSVRSMLLHDDRFVIATSSDIQIAGNEHLTRAQVLSVFGSDLERNIFKIPLGERRGDLERLPWVSHATVMRLLPNRIRVSLTERVPVAFVRQGTQIGLVDAEGVLLDMPEQSVGDPHYSFPVLTGLSANDPISVRAARMDVYRKFMQDLDSDGGKNSQALSEVDVSNPEDVKALIPSGSTDILVHFGDEDFLNRYKLYVQNLPVWKAQYPKLASVDTRYEHQMVLEMAAGAGVPVAGTGESSAPGADGTAATATASAAEKSVAPVVKKAVAAGKAPVKTAVVTKAKPTAVTKAALTPPAIAPAMDAKQQALKQKIAIAPMGAVHKNAVVNVQLGTSVQQAPGQGKQ